MHFSVREEIIISSCVFFFCVLSIPVMILTKSPKDMVTDENPTSIDERNELLTNSIQILDSLNRNKTEEFTFADLMNLPPETFSESKQAKMSKLQARNIWKKFRFVNKTVLRSDSMELPLKIDWRDKNITRVDSNKNSNHCFANAVAEAIEAIAAQKFRQFRQLSVQQMLDCNSLGLGCEDSNPNPLLFWLFHNQIDIQLSKDYPDNENLVKSEQCKSAQKEAKEGVKVKDYSCNDFVNHEELILLYLAKKGPVIATIKSSQLTSPAGEVIQHECDSQTGKLNHVVLIVGYDMTENVPFYIVKNPWYQTVGDGEVLKLAVGSNFCNISRNICTVLV